MSKKIVMPLVIVVCFLGLAGFIYTHFNGTPWGRKSAEKHFMHSLKEQYQPLQFHVVGDVGYNFKDGHYNIGITFRKLPQVKYVFEFIQQTGKAVYVGYSSQNANLKAPNPVPHSTAWINNRKVVMDHDKVSNEERFKNFIKHVKTGIPGHFKMKKHTVEGSPIFYDLHYDGKNIKYTYDNSQDGYAGPSKGKHRTTCKSIEIKKTDHGAVYVLSGCASNFGNTFSFPVSNK